MRLSLFAFFPFCRRAVGLGFSAGGLGLAPYWLFGYALAPYWLFGYAMAPYWLVRYAPNPSTTFPMNT